MIHFFIDIFRMQSISITPTPEQASRFIRDGFAILTGVDPIKDIFRQVAALDFDEFEMVPSAVGGLGIQGRLDRNSEGKRHGLYFTPAVSPFLNRSTDELLTTAYNELSAIANRFIQHLPHASDLRRGSCIDVLTVAQYDPTRGDALVAHTDFGLLTFGIANKEGLEIRHGAEYVRVQPGELYVHTASWLQLYLRQYNITDIGSAEHIVRNIEKGRVFMGLFYEPALDSRIHDISYAGWFSEASQEARTNGITYQQFLVGSFKKTYAGGHPAAVYFF